MELNFLFRIIVFVGIVAFGVLNGQTSSAQSPAPSSSPGPPTVRRADPASSGNSQTVPSSPFAGDPGQPAFHPGSIYEIAREDVLNVKVVGEPDLETTARVGRDGTINFPYIGTVAVAGKTADDAARLIGGALAKDYIINPQVTISVVEYAHRTFTVLGEVAKPGTYDMPDRRSLTLLEAIGSAGGYTRIADPSRIRIRRIDGDKETIVNVNAKKMTRDSRSLSFEVKVGDVITVEQSFF